MKSVTSGMTMLQRVEHVGGRTKDNDCVEFGSMLAVNLFADHLVRDVVQGQPLHSTRPVVRSIEQAEKKHGSLRAAARALGMDPSYLFRLKNSEKMHPSDEVLKALGLERVTFYRRCEED
jgi:hypothetical protein